MIDIDINNLRGTATWDRSQQGGASADPFQELANAVILLAAKDYYNLHAGFNLTPPPNRGERYPTIRELERFFRSELCGVLTNINVEQMLKRLKAEAAVARKIRVVYTVSKQGERYYVHKVGEAERLSMLYRGRTHALHRAAELQGVEYDLYMKVRKREGIK